MVAAPKFDPPLQTVDWRSDAGRRQADSRVIPLLPPNLNCLERRAQRSIAPMTSLAARPSSAFRAVFASDGACDRKPGGTWSRFWVSLSAGLLAGAGLALGLALAQHDGTGPGTPAERNAAPRPAPGQGRPQERPYVQPILVGMGAVNSIAGASALPRGSAAFWRDGEASLTEAAFSLVVTG